MYFGLLIHIAKDVCRVWNSHASTLMSYTKPKYIHKSITVILVYSKASPPGDSQIKDLLASLSTCSAKPAPSGQSAVFQVPDEIEIDLVSRWFLKNLTLLFLGDLVSGLEK